MIKPKQIHVAWLVHLGRAYFLGEVPEGTKPEDVDISEFIEQRSQSKSMMRRLFIQFQHGVRVGTMDDFVQESLPLTQ